MSTQQPSNDAGTILPVVEPTRRFLDNDAPQPFRGLGNPHPRLSQVDQRSYVPPSSAALVHLPPNTKDRPKRDPSIAASTEPWPPLPPNQFQTRLSFLSVGASDRSSELIAAEPERDTLLAQLMLDTPESNIARVDGRHRTAIPIISGAHARVSLKADQRVGIDISSLLVLSHLALLREVFRTFQNIVLAPDIESELHGYRDGVSKTNPLLGELVEEIASHVAKSVESGTASILRQSISGARLKDFGFNRKSEDILTLMTSACDVFCIDDPRCNRCKGLCGDDSRIVPIACTVDLLRALMETNTITRHDYWQARHKLREFGFTEIMPDAEELHYLFKNAFREDQELLESFELRAIRHSIAHVAQNCQSITRETAELLQVSTHVCNEAINNLWDDESISIHKSTLGSDWIWINISPLRHLGGLSLTSHAIRVIAIRSLAYLLIPRQRKPDRKAGYIKWCMDSVLPLFQCANPNIIDEALDLIAEFISDNEQCDAACGQMFINQLPISLTNRLLKRRLALGDKWGFSMNHLISFDSGPSISINGLIECTRRAYAAGMDIQFTDDSGWRGTVALDQESNSVSIRWTDEHDRQRTMSMPHLTLLCPVANLRVNAAQSIIRFLGATFRDMRQLSDDIVSRTATDEEVRRVSNEFSNGMKSLHEKLHWKVIYRKDISVDDVVPPSMGYFEQLVGPCARDSRPDNFVQDVIIPYRKGLLSLDLKSGLEIACLGFLSDSLGPGEWVKDFSNDDVWDAFSGFDYSASPFVLLAGLDVALYRQEDTRYQELATSAVNALSDRSFGRSDSFDIYEALHLAIELVENSISTLDSGAIRPVYWRRMAAWMQAALFVGYLASNGLSENMVALREFSTSNMTVAGRYARTAAARVEPLAFAARVTPDLLHTYLMERLMLLKLRHERLGHVVPTPETSNLVADNQGASEEARILGIPGPLDGHRMPTKHLPPELVEAYLASTDPDSEDFPWQSYVTLFQTHQLDGSHLAVFRIAVQRLRAEDTALESTNPMRYADYASMVAAACRDRALADTVADLIVRLAAVAREASQLGQMIGCLLQTAAAHSDQSAWSGWLEDRLAQMANQLPPPPSDSSRVFADLLDELGSVLPVDSWVHLRARAICGCIAPAAPRFRADFIEEGWLDDARESLEGIREEANELGFDVPSDIAIRSARAFLESLAQVVRQTPDVQPLQDGGIGIDFYNQTGRGGVVFVVEIDGAGACYAVANGVSESFIRSSYKDLLDDEIREAVTSAGVG